MERLYCKLGPEELKQRVLLFMSETSRLPDVAVSEIAMHPEFADVFEDYVPEGRRWRELGQLLREAGAKSGKRRSQFFKKDGSYASKVSVRFWFDNSNNT